MEARSTRTRTLRGESGPAVEESELSADPARSAWNAVIKGAKYWIVFPSSDTAGPPPGVFVSADQSEVTSPLSIAEWLLGFHAEARRAKGCLEGICYEGEVLHVPSGKQGCLPSLIVWPGWPLDTLCVE